VVAPAPVVSVGVGFGGPLWVGGRYWHGGYYRPGPVFRR
jgi:hypothetical protein